MEQLWPADKVRRRAVAKLVPSARNARLHSPAQIAQIAKSIQEFGFTNPVLLDEKGRIIAGHGRVLAAKQLGLVDVPCMVAKGWTEAQKRAYVIADNALALKSGWDTSLLISELGELQAHGFDIEFAGFSLGEFETLKLPFAEGATDTAALWAGMPEFTQQSKEAFRIIPVHFKDQEAVDRMSALIGQKISDKTRFILYPAPEIERYADKRYTSAAE